MPDQYITNEDGQLVAYETAAKETRVPLEIESVSTEDADISDQLEVGGRPAGSVAPTGQVTFVSEWVDQPFSGSKYDPEIVDRRHFDDNEYRVVFGDNSTDETFLYRTPDFESYTQIATDILPNVSGTGQVAGIEVLSDGTFVFTVLGKTVEFRNFER